MAEQTATPSPKNISPGLKADMEAFQNFLKAKKFRVTRERLVLAEAVLQNRGHFDVDELYLLLKDKVLVSRASIYRNIPLLIEAGLLAAGYLENGHMHYERACGRARHSHLRCTSCGWIGDFSAPELPALAEAIAEQKNFKTAGYQFELWGLCSRCR